MIKTKLVVTLDTAFTAEEFKKLLEILYGTAHVTVTLKEPNDVDVGWVAIIETKVKCLFTDGRKITFSHSLTKLDENTFETKFSVRNSKENQKMISEITECLDHKFKNKE